jgi:uncharacterized repeat protein (TIGR03803 family)
MSGTAQSATALIQGTDGNLYGTTADGGASGNPTVFKITAGGTLTTLHSFGSYASADSIHPLGLVQATNGDFYWTTQLARANGGDTIFKIAPTGTLTTLYSFCSQNKLHGRRRAFREAGDGGT